MDDGKVLANECQTICVSFRIQVIGDCMQCEFSLPLKHPQHLPYQIQSQLTDTFIRFSTAFQLIPF